MANASDKARFHLEISVPELREWQKRKIFTKHELTTLTTQRNHHETILASRETTPATTLAYYTHERNLTSLLSARLSRSPHSTLPSKIRTRLHALRSRHLFSLLERGTRRHHGDLGLWSQYLALCEERGAGKRQAKVVSEIVRLFPTRGEVWGMAAEWAEGMGDFQAARGFWMRGVRFCGRDWGVRVGWARCEMRWVERARKALGLDAGKEASMTERQQIEDEREEDNADIIAIATSAGPGSDDAGAVSASKDLIDTTIISSSLAITGEIPKAIFDSAMKDSSFDLDIFEMFMTMFLEYPSLPCTPPIIRHMSQALTANLTTMAADTMRCQIDLLGTAPDSLEFPAALRRTLQHIRLRLKGDGAQPEKRGLAQKAMKWFEQVGQDDRCVPELQQALQGAKRQLERDYPVPVR